MAANADIVGEVEGFLWKLDLTLWTGDLLQIQLPKADPFRDSRKNSQTVKQFCMGKSVKVFKGPAGWLESPRSQTSGKGLEPKRNKQVPFKVKISEDSSYLVPPTHCAIYVVLRLLCRIGVVEWLMQLRRSTVVSKLQEPLRRQPFWNSFLFRNKLQKGCLLNQMEFLLMQELGRHEVC